MKKELSKAELNEVTGGAKIKAMKLNIITAGCKGATASKSCVTELSVGKIVFKK